MIMMVIIVIIIPPVKKTTVMMVIIIVIVMSSYAWIEAREQCQHKYQCQYYFFHAFHSLFLFWKDSPQCFPVHPGIAFRHRWAGVPEKLLNNT